MKKAIAITILLAIILSGCELDEQRKGRSISVIPKPVKLEKHKGVFRIKPGTRVIILNENKELKEIGQYLADIIENASGYAIDIGVPMESSTDSPIILQLDENLEAFGVEGYDLAVHKNRVELKAYRPEGLFYGVQTLLQLLPPEVYSAEKPGENIKWIIPCLHIFDKPLYEWRGMHLDVSRHFFPVDFIKRYIDLMAMHKMNLFHWHLTDNNGWRIEIMKYPLLSEISAWRVDRENQSWSESEPQKEGEKATYGGFYTQDEIKEVVEYARQRHITIVPEIEMPGHTSEVFASYPELSCKGELIYVPPGGYWPNIDIFCAGNDQVFTFLEDVLLEVIELFPSEYIHIGGDEADKTRWIDCPKCQKRIRDEGLKDVDELQSYFIKRIEKFLNSKGKKLIGWDEILEGGLAPEATVMSWRGFEGGVEAAKQGHDVVMCPGSHCYFDHYQADPDFQPEAIGGYTTLKKVYSFDPIPPDLNDDKTHYVLGAQGNVWTEFISTPEKAEYMSVPRMTALAEVVWTPKELQNWDDFNKRLQTQFRRFDELGVNYCKGSFSVGFETLFDSTSGKFEVALSSEVYQPEIRYTLDGSDPVKESEKYASPFIIDTTTTIKAVIYKEDSLMEKVSERKIFFHKALRKPVKYENEWSFKYPGMGATTLVDGIKGSERFNDHCWQGFNGDDLIIIIDLEGTIPVRKVNVGFYQTQRSWIFLPAKVDFSIVDEKGNMVNFEVENDVPMEEEGVILKDFSVEFEQVIAKEIVIHAWNIGVCPVWHPGAGGKAWIFVDEIIIE